MSYSSVDILEGDRANTEESPLLFFLTNVPMLTIALLISDPDDADEQLIIGSSESTTVEGGVATSSPRYMSCGNKKSGPSCRVLQVLKYGERSFLYFSK